MNFIDNIFKPDACWPQREPDFLQLLLCGCKCVRVCVHMCMRISTPKKTNGVI